MAWLPFQKDEYENWLLCMYKKESIDIFPLCVDVMLNNKLFCEIIVILPLLFEEHVIISIFLWKHISFKKIVFFRIIELELLTKKF